MMPIPDSTPIRACVDAVASTARGSVETIRWLSFWTAAVLPILYIPLAFVMEAIHVDVWLFGELIALHIVALIFGHGYGNQGGIQE